MVCIGPQSKSQPHNFNLCVVSIAFVGTKQRNTCVCVYLYVYVSVNEYFVVVVVVVVPLFSRCSGKQEKWKNGFASKMCLIIT